MVKGDTPRAHASRWQAKPSISWCTTPEGRQKAGNRMPLKPLKWYKQLATKKGRLAAGAFLVEGPRAIAHLVQHHPDAIVEIVSVEVPPPAWHNYPQRHVTAS